jgi:site-specific recombinase XerD
MDIITNHNKLIEEYLSNRDIVDSSKKIYRCIIKGFFNFIVISGKDATRPSTPDAIAYRVHLEQAKLSTYTIILYLTTLKTFFFWLHEEGKYDKIPTAALKRIKKSKDFTKLPLNNSQSDILLSSINTSTIRGQRDYLMISLALTTGLRTNEIANINLDDINGIEIKVLRKRHRVKDVTITIPHFITDLIEDYISARMELEDVENESSLFTSHTNKHSKPLTGNEVSKIIKLRMVEAGLKDKRLTAHSLRHTCAVNLIAEGIELPVVQRFMDHADLATTQIYTRIEEYRRLKELQPQEILSKRLKNRIGVN